MNLRIGHSPDPDDAFLFYGLTQGKVPLEGISIIHSLKGIEELNQEALSGDLEMTAVSLHAYAHCADRYLLLRTGASVGEGYGPVVVSRSPLTLEDLKRMEVAVPGPLTTARLLLDLAVGPAPRKYMPFDRILDAVLEGQVPAGVLIHEGQVTYGDHGLKKVVDLGQWWCDRTRLPVPLGVNVVRRDLGEPLLSRLAAALRESLDYAFAHKEEALGYAGKFARGLDPARVGRFVGMYVNRWSVDCKPDAAEAMQRLLDEGAGAGLLPGRVRIEFADP